VEEGCGGTSGRGYYLEGPVLDVMGRPWLGEAVLVRLIELVGIRAIGPQVWTCQRQLGPWRAGAASRLARQLGQQA
jgi:hypothetical protein